MFRKFIFFIGWIGIGLFATLGMGIAVSLGMGKILIPVNYVEILSYPNQKILLLSLFATSFFYFLLFVEKAISLFIKEESGYEFKTETGMVSVSDNSLNALVKDVMEQDKDIKNVKVVSSKGKKGLKVEIKVDITALSNLSEKLGELQLEVKEELIKKLSIDIEKIDIRANKLIFVKEKKVVSKFRGDNNEVGY